MTTMTAPRRAHGLRSMLIPGGIGLVLLSCLPSLAAVPDLADPRAEAHMAQLERRVEALQRQVHAAGGAVQVAQAQLGPAQLGQAQPGQDAAPAAGVQLAQAQGYSYQLEDRMNGLEQQMRNLTGQVEELQHRIQQLNTRLEKFTTDSEFRLNQLEGGNRGGGMAQAPDAPPPAPGARQPQPPQAQPSQAQPGQAQPQPTQPPQAGVLRPPAPGQAYTPTAPLAPRASVPAGTGNPQQDYDAAFALLRQADYPAAEQALRSFVARYPQSELAGNAQYWLGETYYVRRDYQNAAVAFADGYRNYPRSAKAPDTLLKLGMSLAAVKKDQDACAVYDRLSKDYPQAPEVIRRRVAEERRKSGC